MPLTQIITWYLENTNLQAGRISESHQGKAILSYVFRPDPAFYRDRLYNGVGESWTWYERANLSDTAIAALIHVPGIEVYLARYDGVLAGYLELDRRNPQDVEVAYFGFLPDFTGRSLGPWMMGKAKELAAARGAERLWVHTCSLDHPKAVSFYETQGFSLYKTETTSVEV